MDEAVWGLIGVIVGAIITIVPTIYTTRATIRAAERKERREYLSSKMDMLTEALAEYEEYLAKYSRQEEDSVEHARIIGKAIAACLAVADFPGRSDIPVEEDVHPAVDSHSHIPDVANTPHENVHAIHRLTYIGNRRLTRNFVTRESNPNEAIRWGSYRDRNRHALDHAVKRLAQLIAEIDLTTSFWQKLRMMFKRLVKLARR